jgi:hypothetical protein
MHKAEGTSNSVHSKLTFFFFLWQLGSMLSSEGAAKIGLVDDVVAPELVFDSSVAMALKFAALPCDARHRSKVMTMPVATAPFQQLLRHFAALFHFVLKLPPDGAEAAGLRFSS